MTIHYTKKKAKHGGVYGNRGLFFHCIRIHFDRCGFGVYAMNTKGRLSNCQITRSTKSGVISYKNSTIEIEGEDTTIEHNVVDGSSDSYGLKTFHSSSFIHLLSPLTKELVSFDNDRTKRPNPKQRKKFLKAQKKEKGEDFEFDRNDFVDYDSPLQTLKGKNWGCGSGSNCSTPAKPIASSAREDLEKVNFSFWGDVAVAKKNLSRSFFFLLKCNCTLRLRLRIPPRRLTSALSPSLRLSSLLLSLSILSLSFFSSQLKSFERD